MRDIDHARADAWRTFGEETNDAQLQRAELWVFVA
jgi:hypothetical protein